MIEMADQPHDDDDLAAAAAAALRQHDHVKSVLDLALNHAASSMLAEQLGEGEPAAGRFATAMWELLEDRLDDDDRIAAIAVLLEPLAERRAHELRKDFYDRLSRVPEVPDPLARKERGNV